MYLLVGVVYVFGMKTYVCRLAAPLLAARKACQRAVPLHWVPAAYSDRSNRALVRTTQSDAMRLRNALQE